MPRPVICIVTPALADANNGNWQTAARWARLLARDYRVQLVDRWDGGAGDPAVALLALHARRSAESIARWAQRCPGRALIVVLTGTDLYRDIHSEGTARHSLAVAARLVVLHELAVRDLPAQHRDKALVCFQSTAAQLPLVHKTERLLRALMVGHLRQEKAPQTYFEAARLLARRPDIRLDHIGGELDPTLGQAARATQGSCPQYRWLGALPHAAARQRIRRAHVLVHSSQMEGGAHVIMEAVRSGTPVLASRIPGNVGMLGAAYGGYFDPGDAQGLATLLQRCRDQPPILAALRAQCAERAPLFEPERERACLLALLGELLETP